MGAKDGPNEAPEASDLGEKGFATLNSLRLVSLSGRS